MKIGIDIRTLMDNLFSGVSLYTYNLLNAIFANVKSNDYKLFYNSLFGLNKSMPNFSNANVIKIRSRWPNKIFNYLLQKNLKYPKVDSKIGVDLFFMPHINFIALSQKCRKIITIHDLSYLRYPIFFSRRKNIWHKLINVKKILKKFDIIIAVSKNTKKDIIELTGIDEKKIKIIYSGLSYKYQRVNIKSQLHAVKLKYGLPDKFILFLGTIEPRKNVSGVIKAFEIMCETNNDLKDYYLIIAGARGWKSAGDLINYRNSRYQERMKIIGYVAEEDKPAIYSLAELFVYPSFYEGFGFPPLEALACGCPTIAGNGSCFPEILNNSAILVNPFNIKEIAMSITSVLLCEKFRKNSISNSSHFNIKYNWQVTAKDYLNVFRANI
jgi:glycosyltransferase involved in cell wall biosynthesis